LREPVINIEARPIPGRDTTSGTYDQANAPFLNTLYLSNIGNDTLDNFFVQLSLFIVNEEEIYSYGQRQNLTAYIDDTNRTPRQKLWPRLILLPNEKEIALTKRILGLFLVPHLDDIKDIDIYRDLSDAGHAFNGEFVLTAECNFRRRSDYMLYADTFYFAFQPGLGPNDNLVKLIGGPKIIKRIESYMASGPQVSINFNKERIELFRHNLGPDGISVEVIKRNENGRRPQKGN
jgi:hypothetical protein